MNIRNFKHALSVTRADDFAQWYQEVISEAEMAEESGVRGCMVIKPWGYGIWERIQHLMDARIKAAGVQNCYFPLVIPLSDLAKEAERIIQNGKYLLLETLAEDVCDYCLKQPGVSSVNLSVKKPEALSKAEFVGVRIHRSN